MNPELLPRPGVRSAVQTLKSKFFVWWRRLRSRWTRDSCHLYSILPRQDMFTVERKILRRLTLKLKRKLTPFDKRDLLQDICALKRGHRSSRVSDDLRQKPDGHDHDDVMRKHAPGRPFIWN
jgi:hypothetical protein